MSGFTSLFRTKFTKLKFGFTGKIKLQRERIKSGLRRLLTEEVYFHFIKRNMNFGHHISGRREMWEENINKC